MATWEDGPEYAPLERPTEFALPETAPLEVVPAFQQSAALAPKQRPAFDGPQAAAVALADLVPKTADERDPAVPFDVAAGTVTSMDSAWGAAHWSPPSGQPPAVPAVPDVGAPAATGQWGPPTTPAWPAPTTPFPPVGPPPQGAGGYPPPGTAQWFGPGPTSLEPPPAPSRVDAKTVLAAATPGLLICLAVGGLIYLFAPVMLTVAFFLSQRVRVGAEQVRRSFYISFGFLGFFALAGFMMGRIWFTDWWKFVGVWALVICWGLLVTVLVIVYRGLKSGRPQPPRYSSSWG